MPRRQVKGAHGSLFPGSYASAVRAFEGEELQMNDLKPW